ncbi:hypothetical protein [Actinomyces sp. Z5]|uniref:hypothetical protein n=1 Tax=Actinomyces sp. Z5 TaxID=2250216 RepID=UPI0011BE070D|nr:hypothetical protein [Actinomyces sp. Z5]
MSPVPPPHQFESSTDPYAAPQPTPQNQEAVGYSPEPPAPAGPSAKKNRMPLIIGAVLGVIVLVAAGVGIGALLRSRGTSGNATASASVSADWAEGSHQTWSLELEPDSYIRGNGSQLAVASPTDSLGVWSVAAYDTADGAPQEQWSVEVEVGTDEFRFEYWGDYLVVGGTLLETSDGGAYTAPWESRDAPEFLDEYALLCTYDGTCTSWTADDPSTSLWEQQIDEPENIFTDQSTAYPDPSRVYQDDQVAYVSVSRSKAVDLATGDVIDFDLGDTYGLGALADGWVKVDHDTGRYTLLSPTGKERDSFEAAADENPLGAARLFDAPNVTAEQITKLAKDGDLSWARAQVRTDEDAETCTVAFLVDGTELDTTQEDWGCSFDYTPYLLISDDDSLVMMTASSPMQTASTISLRGMWTTADGKLISLGENEFGTDEFYLMNPELIVAYDPTSGEATGYAPGAE